MDEVPVDSTVLAVLPFQRILVTGAYGFVGRHLVPALSRRLRPDARIYLAGRSGEAPPEQRVANVHFDLEDPASIAAALAAAQPDLIIHLAGQASVGQSAGNAAATWSVNLGGSLALARAVAASFPDATVLFASSVEVYGLTFNHEVATEASPLRPQSVYARSKAAAEMMFADVLPATAQLIVARPSNHSGPGQDEAFVVPSFAAQIVRVEAGASTEVRVGNLDAERDFLDVRDVVDAYLVLLTSARDLPARTTFNIASGRPVAIRHILDRLCALSCRDIPVVQDADRLRPSEVASAAIDTAAMTGLGWAPHHTLDDMLVQVIEHRRASSDSSS